jgi:hypothetical protein
MAQTLACSGTGTLNYKSLGVSGCILADRGRNDQPGSRRFAPPWSSEEHSAYYVVRDRNGQGLAYLQASGAKIHLADAFLDCGR